jgi:hypothetical protein
MWRISDPSNRGSILTSDRTPSFLETVLTCHGFHQTNSYFISIMTRLWGTKRPGRKTHHSLLLVKFKVHHITGHNGPEGKQRCSSTLSVTSELDGRGWLRLRPGCFTPRDFRKVPGLKVSVLYPHTTTCPYGAHSGNCFIFSMNLFF